MEFWIFFIYVLWMVGSIGFVLFYSIYALHTFHERYAQYIDSNVLEAYQHEHRWQWRGNTWIYMFWNNHPDALEVRGHYPQCEEDITAIRKMWMAFFAVLFPIMLIGNTFFVVRSL
jgi:hypothetical protein